MCGISRLSHSTLKQLVELLQKIIRGASWLIAKGAIEQGLVFTQYLGTLELGVTRTIIRPIVVPGAGLEPARPQWPGDFKCLATASRYISVHLAIATTSITRSIFT